MQMLFDKINKDLLLRKQARQKHAQYEKHKTSKHKKT